MHTQKKEHCFLTNIDIKRQINIDRINMQYKEKNNIIFRSQTLPRF